MDCSLPVSSVHRIFRQEYWSELLFTSSGNLPNMGIKHTSLLSPALVGEFSVTGGVHTNLVILSFLTSILRKTEVNEKRKYRRYMYSQICFLNCWKILRGCVIIVSSGDEISYSKPSSD